MQNSLRCPMFEPLEVRRFLDAGMIDTSFGANGVATAPVVTKDADLTDIATLPDGRFIVTGTSSANTLSVIRFLSDGSPDPSFGTNGRATSMLGSNAQALALGIQSDRKTVVVGQRGDGYFILRYLTNGKHDKTFGDGGLVTGHFGKTYISRVTGVVINSTGQIVIAGDAQAADLTRSVALARFNADGSPDQTFGRRVVTGVGSFNDRRSGEIVTKFSFSPTGNTDFRVHDLTQAIDGSLFVTGSASLRFIPLTNNRTDVAVAHFTADGTPDTSFGGDGLIVRDFGSTNESGSGIKVDSAGRPVVSLFGIGALAAARFTSRGHLDTPVGINGVARVIGNSGSASDVLIQSDGKIVLGGRFGATPILARFDSSGAKDRTFGTDGLSEAIPFSPTASISRLAFGSANTILAAGAGGELGRSNTRLFSIARIETE